MISITSFVVFLAAGIAGFTAFLTLSGSASGALGWILIAQACCVLAAWPRMYRSFNYAVAPAVLLLLSGPLYAAGVMWGGAAGIDTALSVLLLYMLFIYAALMMKLEQRCGVPAAAWYVPTSVLLVGGPILIHYVLAEYLKRPLPWVAAISPMVALSSRRHLAVGCGAWVGVLVIVGAATMLLNWRSREAKPGGGE